MKNNNKYFNWLKLELESYLTERHISTYKVMLYFIFFGVIGVHRWFLRNYLIASIYFIILASIFILYFTQLIKEPLNIVLLPCITIIYLGTILYDAIFINFYLEKKNNISTPLFLKIGVFSVWSITFEYLLELINNHFSVLDVFLKSINYYG